MATTINLTTADNNLTVLYNGTTIKKIYYRTQAQANAGQTGTQVYQKWKTYSACYSSCGTFSAMGYMTNTNTYSYQNGDYNIYRYYIECTFDNTGAYAQIDNAHANGIITIEGEDYSSPNIYYNGTENEDSTYETYRTVYRNYDTSYESKQFNYYVSIKLSGGRNQQSYFESSLNTWEPGHYQAPNTYTIKSTDSAICPNTNVRHGGTSYAEGTKLYTNRYWVKYIHIGRAEDN